MSTGKKIAFGVLIFFVVILVALVIMVPILLDVDRYRPQVIAHVRAETGKPAEIRRLSLTLFPTLSIRVDDFALGNPTGFPQGIFLKVGRIYAVLDARALWNRQILIKSLELNGPDIVLLSDARGRWNFENPSKQGIAQKVSSTPTPMFTLGVVSKVKIIAGHLTTASLLPSGRSGPAYFDASGVASELDQVNLNAFVQSTSTFKAPPTTPIQTAIRTFWGESVAYAASSESRPAAEGVLKAESLQFGALRTTAVKCKLKLFPKRVYLSDLHFDLYGGHASSDVAFDFAGQNPRYSADTQVKGVDVAKLLEAFPDARGKMTGKMEGSLKLTGEITHTSDPMAGLRGIGQFDIRNGRLPSLQLNKNLMELTRLSKLGPGSGDASSFSSIAADMNIANQRITSNKIVVVGNGLVADGSGSLSLAGEGSINYEGIAKVSAEQNPLTNILANLSGATFANGKLSFPFTLGGTLQNPRFRLKTTQGVNQLGLFGNGVAGSGPQPNTQLGQTPQKPADLMQGIVEMFKKKQSPQQPPKQQPKP